MKYSILSIIILSFASTGLTLDTVVSGYKYKATTPKFRPQQVETSVNQHKNAVTHPDHAIPITPINRVSIGTYEEEEMEPTQGLNKLELTDKAPAPFDDLTVEELQSLDLLSATLVLRVVLRKARHMGSRRRPIRVTFSRIEKEFMRLRAPETHDMDRVFFGIWEEYQILKISHKDTPEKIEEFKKTESESIPKDLSEYERGEIQNVIDSIDVFA